MGCGQAVLKSNKALIGPIDDLFFGLGNGQKDLTSEAISLFVGRDLHPVVVGDDQLELQLGDIPQGRHLFRRSEVVPDIVDQLDHICAARLEVALTANPASDQGGDFWMWLPVDHHLVEEEQCPRLRGFRGIVRDPDDHGFHAALVLRLGQHAF